jgi:hypothetical protein
MDEETQGTGQGHGAYITEPESSGPLALPYVGLVDTLEERIAYGTALTGTLDHKHPLVDLSGLGHQLGQVLEAGEDPDVMGFVDHGFDTQRPPFP